MVQNTFSEQDSKEYADFLNFVWTKMKLDNPENKDAFDFGKLYTRATQLKKKIDDNIMELREVVPAKKDKK